MLHKTTRLLSQKTKKTNGTKNMLIEINNK
jgi:hypothetical protein